MTVGVLLEILRPVPVLLWNPYRKFGMRYPVISTVMKPCKLLKQERIF
jgi:hypothetical protein